MFGFGEVLPFRENIVIAPPRGVVGGTFRDWEESFRSKGGMVDVNVFAGGQTHGSEDGAYLVQTRGDGAAAFQGLGLGVTGTWVMASSSEVLG